MKKIKFNWGTGIIISSIVFMTFTVITGITLMNQKVDLVTDNYYEKELKYQNQIDKMNRTEGKVDVLLTASAVDVSFTDANELPDTGEIIFYRPSNSALDFKVPVAVNNESRQSVSTAGIEKGFWKVQVNWSSKGREYYFEKPLMVN